MLSAQSLSLHFLAQHTPHSSLSHPNLSPTQSNTCTYPPTLSSYYPFLNYLFSPRHTLSPHNPLFLVPFTRHSLSRITNTTLSVCTLALLSHPTYRIYSSLPHSLVQNPIFFVQLTHPTHLPHLLPRLILLPSSTYTEPALSLHSFTIPHTQLSFASTRPTLLLQSLTTHSHPIYIGNTNPSISLIHPVSNSTLSPHSPIYPTH